MESLKMNTKKRDNLESSPPGDPRMRSKLQKYDESNLLSLKTSDNTSTSVLGDDGRFRRMRTALATLRNNLSQTEAIVIQNSELQKGSEGMPEEGKNVLGKQLQMNEDIIQQFEEDLETFRARAHDARAAQAAAEAELSQLKTTITQHIAEAVAFLQGETTRQKELFEEKISALEKELVHMEWLRQQVILLEEKCQESTPKVRKSKAIKPGATSVASENEYYDLLQENEILKFQLEVLKEERDKLRDSNGDPRERATNISRNMEESSSSDDESSLAADNNDDSNKIVEKKNGEQALRFSLGSHYGLVSDRRYFDIDFKKAYKCLGRDKARCKRCSYCAKTDVVKDHIWTKHYGGKFHCVYCLDSNKGYSWKNSLRSHINKFHSNMQSSMDQ